MKKMMKTQENPENKITYEDIEDIVEYLVRTKSYSSSFGCWAPDDIAQEIRIICFQKISDFDSSRYPRERWKNFFGRCVDNALKNLKRDNYLRPSKLGLIKLETMSFDEVSKFKDSDEYEKWKTFQIKLQRKLRILHPIPIDVLGDTIKHCKLQEELEYNDLERHVVNSIAPELRDSLQKMLNGQTHIVPQKDKRKIQAFVKKLLAYA